MIQLRPYQANEIARGHAFTGWPTRDILTAKAILAALPMPATEAAKRFPAPILARLAHPSSRLLPHPRGRLGAGFVEGGPSEHVLVY